ncbi:DUF2778 domain-containing protein [Taylorella equigenitalis]|uniref:Tlde1 domain-containing protein n=1 Tax=Taylorella equigenitalis ATCC 35865 TaxID=743973 RepID=A0ABM5N8T6_9BURK|nr:DUF2778 domain-containing protein [Taylorella equigenitalis]AFN35236.1 hypothetical protein KUI_0135 [Taylorella equigenitalis ATCC 35865]ASY38679.1 hypothetical protein CA604_00685 [Taylorella equigenitalis]WDU54970.1 DUF2778 domain-containing protein [Taylorella equigenitalis]VEG30269.1 Protein of uncharacterised function (DUF2778) [Taylorella equigenitalis ATCC 35865]
MLICRFEINSSKKSAKLICPGIGTFEAFTGKEPYTNRLECAHITYAPIPPGSYWIVDRPLGHYKETLKYFGINPKPTLKDDWFALFRVDNKIDDFTTYNSNERSLFRLHPKVGRGASLGCITLTYKSEFDFLRAKLLNQEPMNIPNTSIRTYGIILVRALDSIKNVC